MDSLPNKEWINDTQWEYYNIRIGVLLSNKIDVSQCQELINIYDRFIVSKKIVPIQLQEYMNLQSHNKNIGEHKGIHDEPLKDYKKVLLISSVLRRQSKGVSKINAINAAAKHFEIHPKVFFDIYTEYIEKVEQFLMVEPDIKNLDRLLGA